MSSKAESALSLFKQPKRDERKQILGLFQASLGRPEFHKNAKQQNAEFIIHLGEEKISIK